jgi:small subunit ribosomal protein S17
MAENETPDTPEETTPAGEPEAPVTPPAEDAPSSDDAAVTDDAPAEETPAAEKTPGAETAPAAEAEAKPTAAEARKAKKLAASSDRPARTHAERQAERDVERRRKAAARRRRRGRERDRAKAVRAANPNPAPAESEHGPGRPKVRQGIVTSDKADKTITVRIDDARRHRRYEKIVRTSSTLHAHDEKNDANTGDVVRLIESRPLSATKRWRLVEVLERAE